MSRNERRMRAKAARDAASRIDRLLMQATQVHQSGRLAEAERLYRRVLAAAPHHVDARHYLGLALHQAGRTEEAVPLLEEAAAARPRDPMIAHNLGEALLSAGRHADAAACFRIAVGGAPSRADCHYGLGRALLGSGDAEGAAGAFEGAVRLAPDDVGGWTGLAMAHFECGRPGQAASVLETALETAAEPVRARLMLADLFAGLDRVDAAERHARAALASDPDSPDALETLARVLTMSGDGDLDEAVRLARRAVELAPDSARSHVTMGLVFKLAGDRSGAEASFRRALAIDPDQPGALYELSIMLRLDGPPIDPGALAGVLQRRDLSERDRASLESALAQCHERAGRHDDAFALHDAANRRLARVTGGFDPQAYLDEVGRMIETVSAAFFAERHGFGIDDPRPVFIVGMPRSGTSLVEQILASHPAVAAGGEREDMPRLEAELRRGAAGGGFAEGLAALSRDTARDWAARHLALLDGLAPGADRVTDKAPSNVQRLALIALLLPGARVVHCRRDAADTAVSCFVHAFGPGQAFSYDLGWIGAYMRGYRRLMAHWEQVLPLPMLTVDYEALVADPEARIRALVDFVGLPWDDACLRPHETRRAVRTASVWQVREPISTAALGRAKAYASHLDPFFAALEGGP